MTEEKTTQVTIKNPTVAGLIEQLKKFPKDKQVSFFITCKDTQSAYCLQWCQGWSDECEISLHTKSDTGEEIVSFDIAVIK